MDKSRLGQNKAVSNTNPRTAGVETSVALWLFYFGILGHVSRVIEFGSCFVWLSCPTFSSSSNAGTSHSNKDSHCSFFPPSSTYEQVNDVGFSARFTPFFKGSEDPWVVVEPPEIGFLACETGKVDMRVSVNSTR